MKSLTIFVALLSFAGNARAQVQVDVVQAEAPLTLPHEPSNVDGPGLADIPLIEVDVNDLSTSIDPATGHLKIQTQSLVVLDKTIDRRTYSRADRGEYYIIFVDRPMNWFGSSSAGYSSPFGHAFVEWAANDPVKKMCSYHAFGLYSKKGSDPILGVPDTYLQVEAMASSLRYSRDRLRVRVDRETWVKSQDIAARWKTANYNLVNRNCVSFVADVARSVGLNTPSQFWYPVPSDFVRALVNSN